MLIPQESHTGSEENHGRPSWVQKESPAAGDRHLCAWGNDVASEVLTEARLLLVENYFQPPS
jgi:hypothetical protein